MDVPSVRAIHASTDLMDCTPEEREYAISTVCHICHKLTEPSGSDTCVCRAGTQCTFRVEGPLPLEPEELDLIRLALLNFADQISSGDLFGGTQSLTKDDEAAQALAEKVMDDIKNYQGADNGPGLPY